MASPKSDDETKHAADADAETRPGVYVQVSSTPRRRKSSSNNKVESHQTYSHQSGDHAVEETRTGAVRRGPGPMGMGGSATARTETTPRSESQVREKEPVRPERERSEPSPVRPAVLRPRGQIKEINESLHDARSESVNSNHRADIVRVSAPPAHASYPPAHASYPPPARLSSPSVLDARPRLPSEPAPVPRTPWGLITVVAVMSSIIAAALATALLEWRQSSMRPSQAQVSPVPTVATPAAPVWAVPAPVPAVPPPAAVAPVPEPSTESATPSAGQPEAPEVVEPGVAPTPSAPTPTPTTAAVATVPAAADDSPRRRSRPVTAAAPADQEPAVPEFKLVAPPQPVAPPANEAPPSELPANPFEQNP